MVVANMNIELLGKEIRSRELANKLTKLNSKVNNDLRAEYVGIYSFELHHLKNYIVNDIKKDDKCSSPLKNIQCEDIKDNMSDASISNPQYELKNNPEIDSPNWNDIALDDQLNSNTYHSHGNVREIVNETPNIENSK